MSILSTIYENLYYTLIYENRYMYFLKGLLNTLIMAFFACIIGIVLGIILAIITDYNEKTKKLPFLSFISKVYIGLIRGTPSLLQLMIIYYIIFRSININIIVVGIISFGLNSAAYVSQIIKSGIISSDLPTKNSVLSTLFISAFNFALITAGSIISTP